MYDYINYFCNQCIRTNLGINSLQLSYDLNLTILLNVNNKRMLQNICLQFFKLFSINFMFDHKSLKFNKKKKNVKSSNKKKSLF